MRKFFLIIFLTGLFFIVLLITFSISRFPGYHINIQGKLLVVNKLSHTASVFDLTSGKQIEMLRFLDEPHEVIASEDQENAIISNYGNTNNPGKSLSIFNYRLGKIIKVIDLGEESRPHGLAIIRCRNKVLVTAEVKKEIILVNLENGVVEMTIPTQHNKPHLIVVHPDGQTAYFTNVLSNSVCEININNGIELRSISCGKGPEGIDISPDGTELWVANQFENTISIINPKMMKVSEILKTNEKPVRLKFTLDGAFCLVNNASAGNVLVFDAFTKKVVHTINLPGNKNIVDKIFRHSPYPVGILMHPTGKYVFISDSNAATE